MSFFSNILFAGSTNSGTTFGSPLQVSNNPSAGGDSQPPKLAASGSNVYLIWGDTNMQETFFAASTNGGTSFSVINISQSGGTVVNANPNIFVSATNVYTVWVERLSGNNEVIFKKSTDSGATFGSGINLSNSAGSSQNPQMAVAGNSVYVVWEEDSPNDILFAGSTNSGTTFGSPVNVSSNSGASTIPTIATEGTFLHLAWQDATSGNNEVLARTISDSGPPSISISSVSNASPRWGLDAVSISGIVNGNATDTITIEWGDGTTNAGIAVSGNSWGPVSHTYDSTNTGQRDIVAKLLDSGSTLKASSATSQVNVQKHATSLTISRIFSVIQGSSIFITGTLTDTDTSTTIAGKTITFNGTGSAGLSSVSTDGSGGYSATGLSPNMAADLLTVIANFAGDASYTASSSETASYDTVATGTAEFSVPATTPSSVTLTGFGTSITFDDVSSPGKVYVSACSAPSSARYLAIDDLCIKISSAVPMASGTAAHVTVSYANKTLPSGHIESEIDIFRQGLSGIVDITESRNTSTKTVAGKTTEFSKFIVGVAIHDIPATGAIRQQIFVGDNSNLLFDFTRVKEVSMPSAVTGSSVSVTVKDDNGNLDSSTIESITATVTSSSDSTGITITLTESGVNTGIFQGSFIPTSSASATPRIHISSGDQIKVTYLAPNRAQLYVTVQGVAESGMLEVVSYDPPNFMNYINPVGDLYKLRLVDARLASSPSVKLTMSYATVSLSGALGFDPTQLRIMNMDNGNCISGITDPAPSALNTTTKTVNGTATGIGQFILALPGGSFYNSCPAPPGGAGGGLARPGSGLVLDAIAVVTIPSSGGGAGGGGGVSLPSTSNPVYRGTDVSTNASVEGETVQVKFDSVLSSGSVNVVSMGILQQAGLFSKVVDKGQNTQGSGLIGGSHFSTAGMLFDVSTTASYSGPIQVTIPYNESLVSDEQNVRFLHYNAGEWEDATVAVNTKTNTVTGSLNSLSPVVAALVDDGTFGDEYFRVNPMSKVSADIIVGSNILPTSLNANIGNGTPITVSATLKNAQRVNQTFVLIVQIIGSDGITKSISWQKGALERGQSVEVFSSWIPDTSGEYKVQVFVWDSMDDTPFPLSDRVVTEVTV
ncbi:hypothetical protein [Nitrososphaera sp.]|uniref:hypothetical protein n=1 Tax=Nitrososphaera sp. TaxID=1971748 RepID=UPI003171D2E2